MRCTYSADSTARIPAGTAVAERKATSRPRRKTLQCRPRVYCAQLRSGRMVPEFRVVDCAMIVLFTIRSLRKP